MESFLQSSIGQLATKVSRINKRGGRMRRRRDAVPLDSAACCLTASRSLTNVLSARFGADLVADFAANRRACCRMCGCVRVARARMRVDSIVGVAL